MKGLDGGRGARWLASLALLVGVGADGSGPPSEPRPPAGTPSLRAELRQRLGERDALRRESVRLAVAAAAARSESRYLVVDGAAGIAELRLRGIPMRTSRILRGCGWPSAAASVGASLGLRSCPGADLCARLDSGRWLGIRGRQADTTEVTWRRRALDLARAGGCRVAAAVTRTVWIDVAEGDLPWLGASLDSAATVVTLSR